MTSLFSPQQTPRPSIGEDGGGKKRTTRQENPIPSGTERTSFKKLLRVIESLSFLVHFLISSTVIFIIAYFFGYSFISDPLAGNDSLNVLSYIVYLNKSFPRIPLWYPYQGGGVSATLGYPQLYSYMVIILHRLTNLTLFSSMGILNFFSYYLPALGTYLFVSTRLKNKTAGLIAGILYFFSPMAAVWIWGAGFLAQTFSVIFVPFFLIFYDWFLESFFSGKPKKISLLLASFLGALAFMSHPATAMGLFAFAGLYTLGRIFLEKKPTLKEKVIRGGLALLLTIIGVLGLVGFWYLPLQAYLAFANRGIKTTADTTIFAPLSFKGTLGIQDLKVYPWGDFSIFAPLWILSLIAGFLGFFFERKVSLLALLAFVGIYFAGSTQAWSFIFKFVPFIADFFTLRPWYPLIIILNPIAAAMAGVFLGKIILIPLFFLETKKVSLLLRLIIKGTRIILLSFLVIIINLIVIYKLMPTSGFFNRDKPWILPIGPKTVGLNLKGLWNRSDEERCSLPKQHKRWSGLCEWPYLDRFELNTLSYLCDRQKTEEKPLVCLKEKTVKINQKQVSILVSREEKEAFVESCFSKGNGPFYFHFENSPCLALGRDPMSQLKHWPLPKLSFGQDNFSTLITNELDLPTDKKSIFEGKTRRIDVTPHLGTTVKRWPIFYESSILNTYTGQLSLIKSYYSLFSDNFYDNPKASPETLNNLAKYFGTEAVVVITSKSPMENFKTAGWERFGDEKGVVFPPFKTGLVNLGSYPKVLVIGNKEKGIYKQVFSAAIKGGLPTDKGILINGRERIGDYTLSQLKEYDLLIFQGYKYKNRPNDLALLSRYLSDGGSVFIDTGWQFVSPDWGREKVNDNFVTDLPNPFPVEKTKWQGVGTDWENGKIAQDFSQKVSLSGFGPLTWEDTEWQVAAGENLRNWAKPVLTKEGKILVAGGNFGKGKIIWSGMNLLAHALDKNSQDEFKFLENIFANLLINKKRSEEFSDFSLSRPTTDEIVVTLKKESPPQILYLREAYFPSWQAKAKISGKTKNLKIQIAGPEFMLVDLPALSVGDQVIFEFKMPKQFYLGSFCSLLTIIFLLIYTLTNFLEKKVNLLIASFSQRLKEQVKTIKFDFTKEEEEY